MSAGLKRGLITASIGQSEGHQLPAANSQLVTQTEEKQKTLRELCSKYEKLKLELDIHTKENDELSKRLHSLQNVVPLLDKQKEEHVQKIKNRQYEEKKRRKEHIAIKEELIIEKKEYELSEKKLNDLTMKYEQLLKIDDESKMKQAKYREQIEKFEAEKKELTSALAKDEPILKDLREYLSQIAKSVFEQQQNLEHMQIGIKSSYNDLRNLQKKIRVEKRNQAALKAKIDQNYELLQRKEKQVEELELTQDNYMDSNHERELDDRRKQIHDLEEIWLGLNDKLISSEIRQAEIRQQRNRAEKRKKRLEAKIRLLQMHPTPSLYKGFMKTEEAIPKSNVTRQSQRSENRSRRSNKSITRDFIEKSRLETMEMEKEYLETSNDLPSHIEYEEYDYVKKQKHDRDQFIKSTETEAESALKNQNMKEERTVLELRTEVEAIEKNVSNLQKIIQTKKGEIKTNEDRIAGVREKISELEDQRDNLRAKLDELKEKKEIEAENSIKQLNKEKEMLEEKRNELLADIRGLEREIAESKHKLSMIIAWKNSINYKELKDLAVAKDYWNQKVREAEQDIKNLEETLQVAKKANSLVKQELKIVKPYEPETYEYEMLKFEESQLNHELAKLKRKKQLIN